MCHHCTWAISQRVSPPASKRVTAPFKATKGAKRPCYKGRLKQLSLSDLPFTAQLCNTEREAGKKPSPGANSVSSTATSVPRALRAIQSLALRGEIANPHKTSRGLPEKLLTSARCSWLSCFPSQACPSAKGLQMQKPKIILSSRPRDECFTHSAFFSNRFTLFLPNDSI